MKTLMTLIIFFSFVYNLFSDENIYFIAGSKVNLRSEPTIESKIITQLAYGQIIDSIEMTRINYKLDGYPTKWTKIKYDSKEGFILHYYIGTVSNKENIPPLSLTLKMTNGKVIQIQNKPYWNDAYKVYKLLSYNKDIGFYIVRENHWEGYSTYLFNDKDGSKYTLIDEPIISPDKKQLLALSIDLGAQYNESGIEIYSIEDHIPVIKYKKMYDHKSYPIWGAKNGKWISNSEIVYTKETLSGDGKKGESQIKMKKVNGNWVEK